MIKRANFPHFGCPGSSLRNSLSRRSRCSWAMRKLSWNSRSKLRVSCFGYPARSNSATKACWAATRLSNSSMCRSACANSWSVSSSDIRQTIDYAVMSTIHPVKLCCALPSSGGFTNTPRARPQRPLRDQRLVLFCRSTHAPHQGLLRLFSHQYARTCGMGSRRPGLKADEGGRDAGPEHVEASLALPRRCRTGGAGITAACRLAPTPAGCRSRRLRSGYAGG